MENAFGAKIKAARAQHGWTVNTLLAVLSDKKVSRAYICKIERHGEIPGPHLICRMSFALKLDLREMFDLALVTKTQQYVNKLSREYYDIIQLYKLDNSKLKALAAFEKIIIEKLK